jgi:hypothetical protein
MRNILAAPGEWSLQLERERVLPGTVVRGRVSFTSRGGLTARGWIAALIATEQWQYDDTETDSQGHTRTVTRTRTQELQRLPVRLAGATTLAASQTVTRDFEVPVPPLGPANFEATVARLTWDLEIKLDMAGGVDPAVVYPIVVLQPTALLAAGVVNVGQWGMWQAVDGKMAGVPYRIALEPVPLCLGQPFSGRLELGGELGGRLREVRFEVKVRAEATVARGREEELVVWRGTLPASGALAAGIYELGGTLPEQWLPSVDLPHGSGRARFDVVFDRPMAPDDHIGRDVALASTSEM